MSSTEQWQIENEKGMRLYQQGHYHTAEQTLRVALHEAEQYGPTDTRVATVLNNLARINANSPKPRDSICAPWPFGAKPTGRGIDWWRRV
jgi:hypothetical protein